MRKALAASVGALVMLAMLASCGGGGSSKSSGSKQDSSEFSTLYNKRTDAKIKVTYQAQGDNSSSDNSEFTIAQDGPDKTAYSNKTTEIIVNGQTVTSCDNLDTTPDCNEVPGGPDAAKTMITGFTGLFNGITTAIASAQSSSGFGDKSSQTVAGRSATCWKWSAGDIGGIGGAIAKKLTGNLAYETCLDSDTGVALSWKISGGGQSASVTAVKVEVPTDADFEPPASASTTTTSEASTDSTDTTDTTETTTTGNSTGTTAAGNCPTTITLPTGITLPNGITVPCVANG